MKPAAHMSQPAIVRGSQAAIVRGALAHLGCAVSCLPGCVLLAPTTIAV